MTLCPHCRADERYLERFGVDWFCSCCGRTFRAVSEVISALGTPFTPNGDGLVGGSDGSKIGKKDNMKLICALLVLLLVPSLAHAEPLSELVSDFERFDVRCGLVLRAPVHPRLHVAAFPAVPASAEGRFIACHVDDPDALILVEQVRLERHLKHADGNHAPSIFADALSAITADSFAQDTATTHGTRAKVDMALIISSVTFSGVAAAYTVLCESAKICHEVNPVMQRLLGRGLPTVIVFKASVNAAAHYLVWRFAPEGKWRTVMLGVIGGINAADAINDGRVVRRALKARG